ncbi:MAG TPA: wax ester/triacylglycerol synthase family O-acyltransferase [Solirubrobacteraceae bacterium]|nr:wax ester/triacylglycerol synthase family O-acyltransferase [Solirubrobacteraceae bacterium]
MTVRRLSPLDASFLQLESSGAHMHVGWSAVFAVSDDHARPTLAALRRRVAGRLEDLPWCRWRLQRTPFGLSEPRWVEDRNFDLAAHVRGLADDDEVVSYGRLGELRDALLSEPTDQARPPWQVCFIPRLQDGRFALLGKIHHSLVDGIAALQIVNLVLDDPPPPRRPASFATTSEQGAAAWAIDELAQLGRTGIGAIRGAVGGATRPRASARAVLRDAGRLLSAARNDVLPRAPDSSLNAPIGERRTLVGYHASRSDLRAARAGGGTLNEIGLALVAGALRALSMRRGEPPSTPLKVMVPVSMRRADETGPGNRISMVYVQLPVHLPSPAGRLEATRAEMHALKASGRPEGTEMLYALGGLVPLPLRGPVVRALASPRIFNLTISQSPGPRGTVHVLNGEMQEVYSVVPIAARHSLAIGMVRYSSQLFIGCYADPQALPEVHQLPALLDAELHALARRGPQAGIAGNGAQPPAQPVP